MREKTHVGVEVLGSLLQNLAGVLGPVRAAGELVDQDLGHAVVELFVVALVVTPSRAELVRKEERERE